MDHSLPRGTRFVTPLFLVAVLGLSVFTIVLFPLFTLFYQYPAYARLLKELSRDEAVGVASHFANLAAADDLALDGQSLRQEVVDRIERLEPDARLVKLRVYSPEGHILYSSVGAEVGATKAEPYFKGVLEQGKVVSTEVGPLKPSLEGELMPSDVVEVYLPLVRRGKLLGVFEVYYDAGPGTEKLRRLELLSSGLLLFLAATLLTAVVVTARRGVRYLRDRQRDLEGLKSLSLSDELTGFHNRRGFFILAEQQMKIARRARRGMLLVSADVDGLKEINDLYGHHEGDRALLFASRVLKESFRESDIICRMGGDEFVVLATDKPDSGAEALLARLERNIERHNARGESPYRLSISSGVASIQPTEAVSLGELLVRADQAMYELKRRRKGLSAVS